jgi:hypothetical protein
MPRKRSNLFSTIATLGALGAGAAAAYALVVRPWHLRWGAADSEVHRPLPGDEVVAQPKAAATHAITLRAHAQEAWPWIVQMGAGRGGFYTYDWLENLMYSLNIRNADRILPEYQELKVGDIFPLAPGGGPPVLAVEPGRYLLVGGRIDAQSEAPFTLKGQGPEAYMAASWLFYLDPVGLSATRLIERFRLDWNPSPLNTLYMRGLLEPGSFIMERGMLLGIKERVERHLSE